MLKRVRQRPCETQNKPFETVAAVLLPVSAAPSRCLRAHSTVASSLTEAAVVAQRQRQVAHQRQADTCTALLGLIISHQGRIQVARRTVHGGPGTGGSGTEVGGRGGSADTGGAPHRYPP